MNLHIHTKPSSYYLITAFTHIYVYTRESHGIHALIGLEVEEILIAACELLHIHICTYVCIYYVRMTSSLYNTTILLFKLPNVFLLYERY